ncbi:MAG: ABC transporter substrate-binding protein [Chloroflexi bacterium]|nr:ABC transporter substrate-binding protein [Chloroflexota bacterium]
MRNKIIALSIFLILALLLPACGDAAQPPAEAVTEEAPAEVPAEATAGKAILHMGWQGKPDTLNPAYAFLTESYTIFDLIYSPLTSESPTGEYVGGLAKEWSVSEDGLTWTFTLKDGIKWHNGEDFKADQIAWAINAVMADPDGWAAMSGYVSGFKEVTAPDDKTVVIVTEKPIANMEYRLSFLYAVYPPDFEGFTTPEDLQNFTNFEAIGTGMFKMNTFDKDTGVLILDANKDYFDGAPKIDQMIFQTFDNADAMIQALKVGDIDLVNELPASAYATVQGFENVTTLAMDGRYFNELIINSVDPNNDPAPTANPALADPAVRLAIASAINKQDIVDIVLQGLATPGTTIVPPTLGGGFWQNPNIKDVEFNIEEANRILEEAGYVKGSDGVRTKDDLRLEFRLQFPSDNTVYPRMADMIADWFSQAGMKANPEAVDPDALVAATTPTGDYDLVLWGWGPDPDPDFILSVMTTGQFVEGGWSDSGYHNPEYDQLYLDQQLAVDEKERQQIVWKMQEMVFNDRPYIVLYYEKLLQAYRSDRFKGFVPSPLGIEIGLSLINVEPVK